MVIPESLILGDDDPERMGFDPKGQSHDPAWDIEQQSRKKQETEKSTSGQRNESDNKEISVWKKIVSVRTPKRVYELRSRKR